MSRDELRALVKAVMGECLLLRVRISGRLEMVVRTWVERKHCFYFLLVHFRLRPEATDCRCGINIAPVRSAACCRGSWPRKGGLTVRIFVTQLRTRSGGSGRRSSRNVDCRHDLSVCMWIHFVKVYGDPQTD